MAQRKHRSAKGVGVDFGLLKIKEQLANEPAPMDVVARQDHIDQRLRRRMRTIKKTTPPAKAAPVTVAPVLPAAERPEEVEEMIDPPAIEEVLAVEEPAVDTAAPVTKQKARKKYTPKKKTT